MATHIKCSDPYAEYKKRPISEHLDDWAASRRGRMSEKQIEETRQRLLRLVAAMKIKTLADWTETSVEQYCQNLKKMTTAKNYDPKKAKPASVQTRNMYRMSAKTFDRWLYEKKRQPEMTLRGLKKESRKKTVPLRQRTPMPTVQVAKLWDTVRRSERTVEGYSGEMRYMLYLTTAATGYRRSELQQLTPESFRLDGEYPEVEVHSSITKNGKQACQPLRRGLVPIFREWLANKSSNELLFPSIEKKDTAKMMKRDLAEAGLQYRIGENGYHDFHQWRHLFISNSWTSGDSPLVVLDLARHADISTTMGYSHTVNR